MTLTPEEIFQLVLALLALLALAHSGGWLFGRFKQPPVIGEILGGLLLGPTVLGALAPEVAVALIPAAGSAPALALGAMGQIGLFLLMFLSGLGVDLRFRASEKRSVLAVTALGVAIPFLGAWAFLQAGSWEEISHWLNPHLTHGANYEPTAFYLLVAVAFAVTSIPVISRIMMDIGVLKTSFARIVLGSAVISGIGLYVVLAIALGMAESGGGGSAASFGLTSLLDIQPNTTAATAFQVLAPIAFLAAALVLGPRLCRHLVGARWNLVYRNSPLAFHLLVMLTLTGGALFVGVTPMFGALVAGLMLQRISSAESAERQQLAGMGSAFFVTLYFALVGLRIDLVHSFDPWFFLVFLLFALLFKGIGVWSGARLAGEPKGTSMHLAVAMNARGGPGILLAELAFDAQLISGRFHTTLILLAVVTSLIAGSWLEGVVRRGHVLRVEPSD